MHTYMKKQIQMKGGEESMVQINCKRCGYSWDYNGKSEWYVSCPRCRTSIKVPKEEEIQNGKQ